MTEIAFFKSIGDNQESKTFVNNLINLPDDLKYYIGLLAYKSIESEWRLWKKKNNKVLNELNDVLYERYYDIECQECKNNSLTFKKNKRLICDFCLNHYENVFFPYFD